MYNAICEILVADPVALTLKTLYIIDAQDPRRSFISLEVAKDA